MTSVGTIGRRGCAAVEFLIIRWNPLRASISDKGGWSLGGCAELRGGGSEGGRPGS